MANQLVAKREELKSKQAALARIFEQAGADLDLGRVEELKHLANTAARAAEVKRLNDELTGLGQEVEGLVEVERAAANVKQFGEGMQHPGQPPAPQPQAQAKSLGEMFTSSAAFKQFTGRQGPVARLADVDVKTLMSTAAGWAPESMRSPGYVPSAQRQPTVLDTIPLGITTQAAVVYMLETTFTSNAAERAEGPNNAGEAALVLTPTTSNVREVAVWLPVTREQMDDVPQVQGYVNNRLSLMLRQRLSSQLLVGDGVAPNLAGLIGLAGVQTQAKGADPTPDAIYKAITAVEVTGRAIPNATIWHPNDWQDVRLLRTSDGIYIWGSPADPGPARIWGLPAIKDSACTENTAVVGDFATFCELATKQEIQFEVTDSHASLFIQRTLAILATIRAAFVVYRPAAFCQVTGI